MTQQPPGAELYLDWNATAPPHPEVLEAMRSAAADGWGNPSSVHATGRRARAVVEEAREAVAELAGFEPRDTAFTSGGTEANNLALRCAPGLALSRAEHPSVVRVGEVLQSAGTPVQWLRISPAGRVEPPAVEAALERLPARSVVALTAANHESGVIQPVSEVSQLVRAAGGRLHVDAVQAFGKLEPSLWVGADSITISAHKIRGPKGIGALLWGPGCAPEPLLLGGAQERGLRPGTLDGVAAAGFLAAVRLAGSGPRRYAALRPLRDRIEAELESHGQVNGQAADRLAHVTNLSFSGWRGDELVAALDLVGVRVSSGSACTAGTAGLSPVILAMLGRERAASAVRISLGDATDAQMVDTAISLFHQVLARGTSTSSGDG